MSLIKPISSPNPKLFGRLVGTHTGAIIVVGGGPSAPSNYKTAIAAHPDALIISANDHAYFLGLIPAYAVCVDVMHTGVKRLNQDICREHNTPLISWRWYSDYRLAQWTLHSDSGMLAICVAAMMGGNPVLPCGFDRYNNNSMYFHKRFGPQRTQNSELGRDGVVFNALKSDTIRMMGGPLRSMWPELGKKPLGEGGVPGMGIIQKKYQEYRVEVVREWKLGRGENAPPGSILALCAEEALPAIRVGAARIVPGFFQPA